MTYREAIMKKIDPYSDSIIPIDIAFEDGYIVSKYDYGTKGYRDAIRRVEISFDYPEETPGVFQIDTCRVYGTEADLPCYDDQAFIDGRVYHSEKEAVDEAKMRYGVSTECVVVID